MFIVLYSNDRNINKGLEFANKALELDPDHYEYLYTKGLVLYKQWNYMDALKIFQKSCDLRREKALYNHEASLHLGAAKKTIANQKNH